MALQYHCSCGCGVLPCKVFIEILSCDAETWEMVCDACPCGLDDFQTPGKSQGELLHLSPKIHTFQNTVQLFEMLFKIRYCTNY